MVSLLPKANPAVIPQVKLNIFGFSEEKETLFKSSNHHRFTAKPVEAAEEEEDPLEKYMNEIKP